MNKIIEDQIKKNLYLLTIEEDGFDGVDVFGEPEKYDNAAAAKHGYLWWYNKLYVFGISCYK